MAVSSTSGSIQIGGLASGLDTEGIITSLLDIEKIPLTRVDERETTANNQLTAWRSLNTRVLALETSLGNLTTQSSYDGRKAATSDETALVATATDGKDLGSYKVTINKLATRHQQISSNGYSATTDNVGTGKITIKVGSAIFDPITIDSTNSNLEGIRDAINTANNGVTASILDTGESAGANRYKLVLNSEKTGTDAAIDVTFDLTGGTKPTMVDLSPAQDAEVVVGSGANAVTVTSSKNTIDDFLPGVTLDLLTADPTKSIDITIARDNTYVSSQIKNMLTNYNNMAKFFSDQFSYDAESKKSGTLFGDSGLLNLQNDMVRAATDAHSIDGAYTSLSAIGIGLDDLGNLSVKDSDAFDKALQNPDDLFKLLNDPDNGVVTKLKKVMDSATTTTTGLISSKESTIQSTLTELKDKRLNILRYVDAKEYILRQQFSNMESTLAMLKSQSNQLASQLGGLTTTQ